MADRDAKELSTEPVLPAQVEALRKMWIEAIDGAQNGIKRARGDAESLKPDNPLRHDLMAHIDAMKFTVELRRAAYDDAWRRFEVQESRVRDAASDRLASINKWLAVAITVATLAQAYYARQTFSKPDTPRCPDVVVQSK